jgi:hypothetical protein
MVYRKARLKFMENAQITETVSNVHYSGGKVPSILLQMSR